MQYYNEEKMKNFRIKLEQEILSWPNVTTKKMYGCPCYKNKEKLFAFLVTNGVVLTKASEQDKMKLSKEFSIKPFHAATRTMKNWPQIPIDEKSDLEKIIPFIKNSYNYSKNLK
jgi:predicted DNA-binding protein (MmcQ/YjbR family)